MSPKILKYRSHICLWMALNTLDTALTFSVLRLGGFELLPVARAAQNVSPFTFTLFKTIVPVAVLSLLYVLNKLPLFRLLNLAMTIVCAWNVLVIIALAVACGFTV